MGKGIRKKGSFNLFIINTETILKKIVRSNHSPLLKKMVDENLFRTCF